MNHEGHEENISIATASLFVRFVFFVVNRFCGFPDERQP